MKTIKFAVALAALSLATGASAMPPQVPDRYYDHYFGFLYYIITAHRPCVGPATAWCNFDL